MNIGELIVKTGATLVGAGRRLHTLIILVVVLAIGVVVLVALSTISGTAARFLENVQAALGLEKEAEVPLTPEEEKAEAIRTVDAASFSCAQLGGYDDGTTNLERFAAAVAHINLAEEQDASTCDVFEKDLTLLGPGTDRWPNWIRIQRVVYEAAHISDANLGRYNQVGLDLEKYLADPTEQLREHPWLKCVTRYMRTAWAGLSFWLAPSPDETMRDTMTLVWKSPSGAEFFCPKEAKPPP